MIRPQINSTYMPLSKARERSRVYVAILFLAPLLMSCRKATQTVQTPADAGGEIRPYSGTLEQDDGQWVRATKDYANTRYSTLVANQYRQRRAT